MHMYFFSMKKHLEDLCTDNKKVLLSRFGLVFGLMTQKSDQFVHALSARLEMGRLNPFSDDRRQKFRLVRIDTNCRRHFKVHL